MRFYYFENERFARREGKSGGYVDYRQVICRIALKMLHPDNGLRFADLISCLVRSTQDASYGEINGYLELHPSSDGRALFLVDKTLGVPPLCFYSSPQASLSDRVTALTKCVDDLLSNQDQIEEALIRHGNREWNDELQDRVVGLFTYRSDERSTS